MQNVSYMTLGELENPISQRIFQREWNAHLDMGDVTHDHAESQSPFVQEEEGVVIPNHLFPPFVERVNKTKDLGEYLEEISS